MANASETAFRRFLTLIAFGFITILICQLTATFIDETTATAMFLTITYLFVAYTLTTNHSKKKR